MQTAPEVIFHDVERSAWVENYMLERVQRLDRFADGITSCRVALAKDQASHHKGNRYSVMVEVRMPPHHDLAARKGKIVRDMQTQLPALINLAFGAIERQLKRTAALRRHEEKRHDGQPRDFERLAIGTEVRFTPQEGEDGSQASSVQIVAKPGALAQ